MSDHEPVRVPKHLNQLRQARVRIIQAMEPFKCSRAPSIKRGDHAAERSFESNVFIAKPVQPTAVRLRPACNTGE